MRAVMVKGVKVDGLRVGEVVVVGRAVVRVRVRRVAVVSRAMRRVVRLRGRGGSGEGFGFGFCFCFCFLRAEVRNGNGGEMGWWPAGLGEGLEGLGGCWGCGCGCWRGWTGAGVRVGCWNLLGVALGVVLAGVAGWRW